MDERAHFVLNEATVMGAAAPSIAIAALSKHTFFVPYFCLMSHDVSGCLPPKKTRSQMGQNGPLGYRSVIRKFVGP